MPKDNTMKILDVDIDLTGLYKHLDPIEDVKIDHSNLGGEFLRQSELTASYGYLAAEAERNEKLIEYQLDRMYAILDRQVRMEMEAAGEKTTEVKIKNTVITHKEYQELKLDLIEARKNKQLFKATGMALNHKLQALVNAGADNRHTTFEPRVFEEKK